ncbi:YdcF family protein [Paradesertivirga mongoliensis]|uniref:YdcF family protein n=1 Tax=Paradesertivirga mongoliensis TaxID=2100740 RepID=A0ABW4ZK64_9SPHI|nr:YdcF family protein [Pedobacter mongoliensis]
MFFILSKLLLIFILPATWIFIALLGALVFRKQSQKRRCLITSFSLLLIFTNPFLLNQFARYWDIEQNTDNNRYSCAIVLGGFVSEDERAEGYFNGSADRFIQALKLAISQKASTLLFTGGNGSLKPSGFREAKWLSAEIKSYNVPDSAVLLESRSRNTSENAAFSKKIIEQRNLAPPYLLVTSAFHMRRSLLTFRKAGLEVVPYSCNYIAGRERVSPSSFTPDARILSTWNFYIKEVLGYIAYYFKN